LSNKKSVKQSEIRSRYRTEEPKVLPDEGRSVIGLLNCELTVDAVVLYTQLKRDAENHALTGGEDALVG
jgi:hypothetical protein